MAAQGTQSLCLTALAVLAPTLLDRYDLSLPELGVLLAAPALGALTTLLLWGFLADRVGERATAAVGLLSSAVFVVAAGAVSTFGALVAVLTAAGALGAAANTSTGRAVMAWFPRERRGFALSLRHMSNPLGGLLAAVSIPSIVTAWGLGGAFAVLGAVTAAAAVGALIAFRKPPFEITDTSSVVRPLRDAAIWRLCIGSAFLGFAQLAVVGFAVLFLRESYDFTGRQAATVLGLVFAAGMAGNVSAGRLSDKLGQRLGLIRAIALATAVAISAVAAFSEAPASVLVPTLVVGGGLSMSWNSLSFAATLELAGRRAGGAAIGLQQTVTAVPVVATPLLVASLVDRWSWRVGYAVIALFPLAAFWVLRSQRMREVAVWPGTSIESSYQ
jgi:sugar phosphate permease